MELITKINWVDVLVAILMLRISYVASRDGLSHEIFSFLGTILIMVLATHYYAVLGRPISRNMMNMPIELANFLSFLILVVALGFLVRLLRLLLDKIVKVQWHPIMEKFGGAGSRYNKGLCGNGYSFDGSFAYAFIVSIVVNKG